MNKNKFDIPPIYVKTVTLFSNLEIGINVKSIDSYEDVSRAGSYEAVEIKMDNGTIHRVAENFRSFDLKVKEALAAVRRELIEKRNV